LLLHFLFLLYILSGSNRNMKTQLLLLAMLLAACVTYAQERFFEGYIVKSSGDTVKGYIREDRNGGLAESVSFKAGVSESPSTFTVKDIRAFGFDGTIFRALNYFDEVDSVQKERFGKLLVEGHYNLYALYFGVAEHYFYVTGQDGKNLFLFDDVMGHTDAIRNGNFRNNLFFIGQSCPNALNTVETMSFSEKDVANFVQQANNCLQPGQASAFHFKKGKTELAGVILFAGGLPLGNGKSQLMGQLMARLVNPSISRKASLNIGFSYARNATGASSTTSSFYTETDHSFTEIYGIPVQLQYNFTSGRFQPYLYTGVALIYKIDRQTSKLTGLNTTTFGSTIKDRMGASVPFGIGFEIYPTSRLMIKADLRYELAMQYPVIGVAYRFK
jgi:hypothetical protein